MQQGLATINPKKKEEEEEKEEKERISQTPSPSWLKVSLTPYNFVLHKFICSINKLLCCPICPFKLLQFGLHSRGSTASTCFNF